VAVPRGARQAAYLSSRSVAWRKRVGLEAAGKKKDSVNLND